MALHRVGISSCLLGEEVRYDGDHKRASVLLAQLGPFVEWVPVCPEIEVGMGVPREPVRLLDDGRRDSGVRLVGVESGRDWTERMESFSRARVEALAVLDLSGYVLKSRSPSCGLSVAIFSPSRSAGSRRQGPGLFAGMLRERLPGMPVEEEHRLEDELACARFLESVRAYGAARSR